jgi:UDP-N-acetylglucosamine 2-epimerase
MKIISIVGARPEFIQALPLSTALARSHKEVLVHTGQHYDFQMSRTFFEELPLPEPAYNRDVGQGSRVGQLGAMIERLESTVRGELPDAILVRGDTTSTLAGALVANQMNIPLIHVEAGERSYDRSMPEEISRVLTDQLADVHFCVSRTAIKRLAAEGIDRSVHWVGDVMLDALEGLREHASRISSILHRLQLEPGRYVLVTVHRAGNTDVPTRLRGIVDALNDVSERVVFPVHPRTRGALDKLGIRWASHVQVVEPLGYVDMVTLESHARMIATDSGGVQREAYFLGVPALTFRDETEWIETVDVGWNTLVGADAKRILSAWNTVLPLRERPPIFGDGHAAERIVSILENGGLDSGRAHSVGTTPIAVTRQSA